MTGEAAEETLTAEEVRELQRRVEAQMLHEILRSVGSDNLLDICAAYKAFKEALIA